ncbi:MAG: hypothetical protein B6I20_07435 [Bacteroidetes bacterium 4572_117]|nr:MAG: hypothetical protein B6I20_07435 [Bacteroidetes bacterium 4572_117]
MSLPYNYKNKISIPESEDIGIDLAISSYLSHIKGLNFAEFKQEGDAISFLTNRLLINLKYNVKLNIKKDERIFVEYDIDLMPLIKATIILIVLTAFFSSFGMTVFLWFSFISSLIFYFANLLFVDNFIKKTIKSAYLYLQLNPYLQDGFTDEQRKWLNDKNRCPACGEEITIYDLNCPDCGLKLKQNKHTIPLDVSKYHEKRFKYHYKKKK